jgi:hypothetical protein
MEDREMKTVVRTVLAPIALGLLVSSSLISGPGCKKDEPPPPLPSAAPAPTPAAPVVLAPEDAGPDVFDAGEDAADAADAKKVVGGGSSGLQRCCAALQQNAASAPPPTNVYMLQAAAACNAAVAAGKDKSSILGVVAGALRGAGLPGACR